MSGIGSPHLFPLFLCCCVGAMDLLTCSPFFFVAVWEQCIFSLGPPFSLLLCGNNVSPQLLPHFLRLCLGTIDIVTCSPLFLSRCVGAMDILYFSPIFYVSVLQQLICSLAPPFFLCRCVGAHNQR